MTEHPAILLCASDGGDDPDAADALARALERRLSGPRVAPAFLGSADRSVEAGLAALADGGAERIVCLPLAPFAADAMKTALPVEINAFAAARPGIEVVLGRDPGADPRLLSAARARLEAVTDRARATGTVLVVVGPGTHDGDANSGIAKMARMIWEGIGFAWAEVAFAAHAFPPPAAALDRAARLGYDEIVVLPYLLADGPPLATIRAAVATAAARHADVRFSLADPLGAHADVVETLAERVDQALAGGEANAMNCQLCTYREQVLALDDSHTHDHHHHHHRHGDG